MIYFQTKNPNLGVSMMGLWMENVGIPCIYLEYFKAIRYILGPVANFVVIWSIFPRFGILHQE
jgi:hypothetical protein